MELFYNTVFVDTHDFLQFAYCTVFNKGIWQSKPSDSGFIVVVGKIFQYGRSQSAADDTVFYGDDLVVMASCDVQNVCVDRFEKTHVVVCHADFLTFFSLHLFKTPDGFAYGIADRANAQAYHIGT